MSVLLCRQGQLVEMPILCKRKADHHLSRAKGHQQKLMLAQLTEILHHLLV